MTIGTNGNDTLVTSAGFDILSGLDGDDMLESTHTGTILDGGKGVDDIETVVTISDGTTTASGVQLGGGGDDNLVLSILGSNNTGSITGNAAVDGGDNDDSLSVQANISSNDDINFSAQINGGQGADTLALPTFGFIGSATGTSQSINASQVIDMGIGNDLIVENSFSAVGLAANTSDAISLEQVIDLGAGDDTLSPSTVAIASSGTADIDQNIYGGSGIDTIFTDAAVHSADIGGEGSGTISQFIDGGTGGDYITSAIDSDILAQLLNTVTTTGTIVGGNGLDTINASADVMAINAISVTHSIDGGRDTDTIDLVGEYETTSATGSSIATHTIDLGTGNDVLTTDLDVTGGVAGTLTTTVTSSQGFNDIDLNSQIIADTFSNASNTVVTGNNSDTLDMDTFSFVASAGSTEADHYADARNTAITGGGNDTITANVQAQSSGDGSGAGQSQGAYALNYFDTGSGADTINAGTYVFSDFIGGVGLAQFVALTGGGADNVDSNMSSDFSELFVVNMSSGISAGAGNDVIESNIDAFARNEINVESTIDGGTGADTITSNIVVESNGTAALSVAENINGGGGADTITTTFDSSQSSGFTGAQPDLVINGDAGNDTINATILGNKGSFDIDGGDGNDTITITSPYTSAGVHLIDGGTGKDTITGSDDWDNIAGGTGEDTIIASGGVDDYWGGSNTGGGDGSADTFVFSPTASDYEVDLNDFEYAFDILQFTALVDTGAAGLVDDIDALGTFSDNGTDVVFTLTAGGSIEFIGAGTGSVNSIADLVNDINSQLIA